MNDQIELQQARRNSIDVKAKSSTVKTILLHLQDDDTLNSRLENALALARGCSAHLSCLHVRPIEAYVAFDSFGGVFVMNDIIKSLDERDVELRSRIEERLRDEGVSWDFEQVTGHVAAQIVRRAALSDLVVTGRVSQRSDLVDSAIGMLGDLIHRSRTPLFIPSDEGSACDPNGAALIAWDGSYEAANAVRAATGLLSLASGVQIVRVEEKEEAFPGTRLLEYLSRHGIHAELSVESAGSVGCDPEFIAGTLLERARATKAYLVMGGYNHSRLSEFVFGGVTRTMLSSASVPLLVAR